MKSFALFIFSFALLSFFTPTKRKLHLFLAGDSTMQNYNTQKTPQRGWGQLLSDYFNNNVIVINKARGGRSTKSFIAEGLWKMLLDSCQKGDFVFIEFGHNDQDKRKPERYTPPADYSLNLIQMVNDVRAKGANPVLFTPIAMRSFNSKGEYHDGHGVYPDSVKAVALRMHVPMIDLDKGYGDIITNLGPDSSKNLFMNFDPGLYPGFPNGSKDNTHLREAGAREVADLAIHGLKELHVEPLIDNLLAK